MSSLRTKLLALAAILGLTGCNLSTEGPLFSIDDAATVQLQSGYYSQGTDVAHIKVHGKTVVNTQTNSREPIEALTVDLGDGAYLLQYGKINEDARTYVMFRYEADGQGIATAVYDCSQADRFFRNFGIALQVVQGGCRLSAATKERMVRAHRALAKALPADSWRKSLHAVPTAEGARLFKEQDSFPGHRR